MTVPGTTEGTTEGVTVGDGEPPTPPFDEQAVNVAASANARNAGSNTMRVRENMSHPCRSEIITRPFGM